MKIKTINDYDIIFDDDSVLTSDHQQDCCEQHYLSFKDLTLEEVEGYEFSSPPDFEKVPGYGIRLIPTKGHPVSIPGYGYNNGYYSCNLTLVYTNGGTETRTDIIECQEHKDGC
jgi:hypothetical protein